VYQTFADLADEFIEGRVGLLERLVDELFDHGAIPVALFPAAPDAQNAAINVVFVGGSEVPVHYLVEDGAEFVVAQILDGIPALLLEGQVCKHDFGLVALALEAEALVVGLDYAEHLETLVDELLLDVEVFVGDQVVGVDVVLLGGGGVESEHHAVGLE